MTLHFLLEKYLLKQFYNIILGYFFSINFSIKAQFITTWMTDNPGISKDHQIIISGKGNYTITWEEMGNEINRGTTQGQNITKIIFPNAGTYKIAISGDLQQIWFNGRGDRAKLLTIERWGKIAWKSMKNAFRGCQNLVCKATDIPNLSQVTSMAYMFAKCTSFNGKISNWNTSNVMDMRGMFFEANSFNQPIRSWNTSKATNMGDIFFGANLFNQPINNWNTGQVINMSGMFQGAVSFN
ncbi:MAG TPA: hypothetical protein DCS93_16840 [Microscillaceae bacterium]|nr:hypothetical protein [Microscillaceae bacterium]